MRTWLVRMLAAAGIAALSGCAIIDEFDKSRGGQQAALPADPSPNAREKALEPAEPEVKDRLPRSASVPIPKRKPQLIDPKALVGMDKSAVSTLLGEPHQVIQSEPATVWAWEMEGCRLRLFFYPDVAANTFRALTYEVSADSERNKGVAADVCPSRLQWAHAQSTR